MSGFDELRQELAAATHRHAQLDGQVAAQPSPASGPRDRAVRRRRLRGRHGLLPLVVAGALGAGGVAYAAVALLDRGAPVPPPPDRSSMMPAAGDRGLQLFPLRVDDPAGEGPPWGLATYRPQELAVFCLVAGRAQQNELGVIGRDGTFDDDGLFHRLDPGSSQSGACGGGFADGRTFMSGSTITMPASGYSGSPDTRSGGRRIAGCNDPVERSADGQRPCPASSLRQVKYGFAGPLAEKVVLENRKMRLEQRPAPGTSGAYLFVYRAADAAGGGPMQQTVTHRGGIVCKEISAVGMPYEEQPGMDRRAQPGCSPPPGLR
jgi:hypothetical protein